MGERRVISSTKEFMEILYGPTNSHFIEGQDWIVIQDLELNTPIDKFYFKKPNLNIALGRNCKFKYDIAFENCHFNKLMIIGYGAEFSGNFVITDTEITESVILGDFNVTYDLDLVGMSSKKISISNAKINGKIEIDGIKTLENISIFGTSSSKLKIKNIPDNCPIEISSDKYQRTTIDTVKIDCKSPIKIGSYDNRSEFANLELKGILPRNQDILIENIIVQTLKFEDFINLGYIKVSRLKSKYEKDKFTNQLIIINSDLGYFNLNESNLSEFTMLSKGSKFNSVFISSTEFIEPKNINIPNSTYDASYFKERDKIDIFAQLRKVFENSGNFLKSTKFHQFELQTRQNRLEFKYSALLKEINNNARKDELLRTSRELKDIYSQLKKMYEQRGDSVKSLEFQAKELEIHMNSPEISWSERISLKFAYWSNNFGTDWIKAVKFLILGAAYLYLLVILAQDCEFKNTWNTLWNILSGFFEFINPIRKLNSITINGNEEILNNKARIVDFFARIFIAFGVYQLIQAFRKYGKK